MAVDKMTHRWRCMARGRRKLKHIHCTILPRYDCSLLASYKPKPDAVQHQTTLAQHISNSTIWQEFIYVGYHNGPTWFQGRPGLRMPSGLGTSIVPVSLYM